MNDYYIYYLIDPRTNIPFYIGKGKGVRCTVHLKETQATTENYSKYAFIKDIRKSGLEPLIEKILTDLPEDVAYELESELIQAFGRIKYDSNGILTNICVDNRPPKITSWKPETIQKRTESVNRYYQKMKEAGITIVRPPASEERKRKISEANKGHSYRSGYKHSEETKQKIGSSNRGNINILNDTLNYFGRTPANKGVPMTNLQKEKLKFAIAAGHSNLFNVFSLDGELMFNNVKKSFILATFNISNYRFKQILSKNIKVEEFFKIKIELNV